MLQYKSIAAGVWLGEVDERFTAQICTSFGDKPVSRPKGIADFGIREWMCSHCGARHDRDTNAANNILRRGRAALAAGITVLGGEDVNGNLGCRNSRCHGCAECCYFVFGWCPPGF